MPRIILFLLLTLSAGCGRLDDFHPVTKTILIQDTVTVNKPFEFLLVLKNDSVSEAKLTIDEKVQHSLSFHMLFHCDGKLLRTEVANPIPKTHNNRVHYLQPGDSLAYKFKALLSGGPNDSLALTIDGYDRVFKLHNPTCNELELIFGGMWLPGDFNPSDSMEGYNFNHKITIIK